MRNAIVAAGVIAAGIAANLGVNSAPGPPPAAKNDSSALRLAAPEPPGDHPLAVLDEYRFPNERPASGGAAAAAKAGTIDWNISHSGANSFEAKLKVSVKADEEEGDWPSARDRLKHTVDEALIVTVPDPLRTHLSMAFDRQLEAIMLAAQDSAYTFDRFWLPWRNETAAESADPEVRKKNEAEKKKREQLPGLLLFRNDSADRFETGTLAIFLVGETPTSGIDRPQFRKAVVFVNNLLRTPPGLRILGPTYSGSFTSLDAALSEMHVAPGEVQIRSGTATAFLSLRKFSAKYPKFSTTVEDDCHTIQQLHRWLPAGKKVAILAEDGTVYGQSAGKRKGTALCGDGPPGDDEIVFYPREISRLRNAYQDDPALAGGRKGGDSTATRRQLIFPLKDAQVGRDTVPQFSIGQTPITQESELLQVAEIIKSLQIHAAVVEGTNILDILFLSRFLRDFCPDIRVIVLNPDLLFVHGTDNLDYTGILAVSVYPLLVPPLPWHEQKAFLRPFASDAAAGVYNAGLAFLKPAGTLRPRDSLRVDDAVRPPIWLSVGSRGAYWPIAVLAQQPAQTTGDPALAQTRPTYTWTALFFACTVLALAYAGIYLHAVGSKRLKRWCSDFHPAPDGPAAAPARRIFHLLTTLLLLAAYSSLGAAPVYFAFRRGSWDWALPAAAAIIAFAALLGAALHTCMRFWRRGFPLVLFAVACIAGAGALALPADGTSLFFFLRSVHLASGVAPNLPLLMLVLVFVCWAWFNMQRLVFIAERDPKVPEFAARSKTHAACLRASLGRCFFIGGRNEYLIFAAVWISTMLGKSLFGSLEGPSYDWVFMTLLSLAGASLLAAGHGYLHVWLQLRLFLEAPALYPLRKAFTNLPTVTSWLWQPNPRKRSYAILHRFLDSVVMLESVAPAYYAELPDDIGILRDDKLTPIAERLKEGERETAEQLASAQERENLIAERLREILSYRSWSRGSSETLEKLPPAPELPAEAAKLREKTLPDLLASEAVALRYVALIRYVMLQLQNQLSFLTGGFILTAIALNCYPFQGENYFKWWLTVIFIIIGTVVVKVFVQMSRDVTLSLLTDTKVGSVDGNFYVRLLSAGALPLLTVVASQFPSVGRFLFSWIQPALSALH